MAMINNNALCMNRACFQHLSTYVWLFAGLVLFVAAGCDTEGSSIYDPDAEGAPAPVISAITPEGGALAGVDVLTITGQNFSANPAENLVYFGNTRGEVLAASATELQVRPPNRPDPDTPVRISVIGAEDFSNTVSYRLDPASVRFSDIKGFEEPFAIATDDAGNVYVSLFAEGVAAGIKRIAPDGTRSDFNNTTFKWDALEVGPDGTLFGARGVRAIFGLPDGSGQQAIVISASSADRLVALDFDPQGNLWIGGNAPSLFRRASDGTVTAFPFEASVQDLVVFDGALYVTGGQNGMEKVWRFPIDGAGNLGAAEDYYNLSQNFPNRQALALAAARNGDLILGTDAANPVLVIAPDRTAEPLYPGVLKPAATSFAWGTDPFLYMSQGSTNTTDPDLIRINTRREGVR